MSEQPSRLVVVFGDSIERRREAAGPICSRDDLYDFVSRLRAEGFPVEASAAVLDFDPMDFRRWLAPDTVIQCPVDRAREPSATSAAPTAPARPASRRGLQESQPSNQLRRAFEDRVRKRAVELFPEPPRTEAGWFPLVRMLAGEGVPVDVSAAILGVDVDAYRFWMTDGRRQITSAVSDSPKAGMTGAN